MPLVSLLLLSLAEQVPYELVVRSAKELTTEN